MPAQEPLPASKGLHDPKEARKLSDEIGTLLHTLGERPVLLREVIQVTQGRAFMLLLILLALPFCTPVPMLGLSTPFGLVIALIGLRLALRQRPWLPEKLLNTALPPRFFLAVLKASRKILRCMEYLLRPRLCFLVDVGFLHHAYGSMILIAGVLLLLPLPIPFTNTLPAMTIVLLSGALLERDGYSVIGGILLFLATLVFFACVAWGGKEVVGWLQNHLGNLFTPRD